MDTRKNVLEKMSDHELEQYIKPDSKFVPQAIQYAYEILQSRGRSFTHDEQEHINTILSITEGNKTITIHPNYTKASNLIYLSGAAGIASLIWTSEQLNSGLAIVISIAITAFVFGIGYIIGKGNEVARYLFIIFFIFGLIGIPTLVNHLSTNPVLGIINIIQLILQTWAVILLLKIPKNKKV
ncbi:hypothetical protein [Chryseobacterium gallinarum]|uniref:DUF1129 domain-containing protein n=1 Tax=Chryseobacterium gallinarum TaxID=1324352 RepID=A0ABX6KKJ6_CHRGL|nr:hypothetical protein [Chryseobacterium gallinarum]QIY89175.1 hypothetical protein FOB44_00285 [Chryseobacterium gallinarum]